MRWRLPPDVWIFIAWDNGTGRIIPIGRMDRKPLPLSIDGHTYHRKTRARRGRR